MSNVELLAKVQRIKELKIAAEELADEISGLEAEVKAEMTAQEVTKMNVGPFKVFWTPYTSTRLDSKALKNELPDLYARYSVEVNTRRFSIS